MGTKTYSKDARRIVPSNGRLMWLRWVLIIEINRLVKRAFDVAGRESSSRCGDSSGDENMARYAILSQRYSPSLERHSMESPPSQMTVLGWTDVAAIGF